VCATVWDSTGSQRSIRQGMWKSSLCLYWSYRKYIGVTCCVCE